jgi:DNA primase
MAEAGLIIHGPDISEPYDRFRNRLMFPICDARGRVIAFGGRALDAEQKAKYLNSPETPLFHKGRGLYNLHMARKPAYDAGTVIVVEGYMDVIGLAQAGVENAVAPLGTALTEEQIDLLWRLAPEPILCFDGDKAGLKAAFRAMQRARPLLKPGHSFRFALLPDGKDPDDLVREEGAVAFASVVGGAKSFPEMVFSERLEGADDRARLEKKLVGLVSEIKDETVQKHYRRSLNDWMWNHFADVFGWRKKSNKTDSAKPRLFTAESARGRRDNLLDYRFEGELIGCLLAEPRLAEVYFDPLHCLEFGYLHHRSIFQEIISIAAEGKSVTRDMLWSALQGRGLDGRLSEIRLSAAYQIAAGLDFEGLEAVFLRALQMFVARGQYKEVNEEALNLSSSDVDIAEYFGRIQWIARALQTSPLAGDDSYFFKVAEDYRGMLRAQTQRQADIRVASVG